MNTFFRNQKYPNFASGLTFSSDGIYQTVQHCLWETNGKACRKVFLDSDELADHVRECHTPTSMTHHSCHWKDCPRGLKTFQKRRLLMIHIRAHTGERPLVCLICQETFRRPENLRNHERRHTGEQPYECPHSACYERFNTASSRLRHMLVHQDDKPHHCEFPNCDKSYKSRDTLRKHQITKHTGFSAPGNDRNGHQEAQASNPNDPDSYQEDSMEFYDEPNLDPSFLLDIDENEFVIQDGYLEASSADEGQNLQDDDVASETFSDSSGMQSFKKNPTELCQDVYPVHYVPSGQRADSESPALTLSPTSAHPSGMQTFKMGGLYHDTFPDQFSQPDLGITDSEAPVCVLSPTGQEDYREDPFRNQDGALTYETSTSTPQPKTYKVEDSNRDTNQDVLPNEMPQNFQNKFEESTPDPNNTEDEEIDPTEIWQYFYPPSNL